MDNPFVIAVFYKNKNDAIMKKYLYHPFEMGVDNLK